MSFLRFIYKSVTKIFMFWDLHFVLFNKKEGVRKQTNLIWTILTEINEVK